jgi:hypothetical protein
MGWLSELVRSHQFIGESITELDCILDFKASAA